LSRGKILLTDRIRSEQCALALVRRYDCGCQVRDRVRSKLGGSAPYLTVR
jgi:hypothetical protein